MWEHCIFLPNVIEQKNPNRLFCIWDSASGLWSLVSTRMGNWVVFLRDQSLIKAAQLSASWSRYTCLVSLLLPKPHSKLGATFPREEHTCGNEIDFFLLFLFLFFSMILRGLETCACFAPLILLFIAKEEMITEKIGHQLQPQIIYFTGPILPLGCEGL